MGEMPKQPIQLSFNTSLKIDFQGSRVTSHGGSILVRELDGRLGFGALKPGRPLRLAAVRSMLRAAAGCQNGNSRRSNEIHIAGFNRADFEN